MAMNYGIIMLSIDYLVEPFLMDNTDEIKNLKVKLPMNYFTKRIR